jgi:type 1 fimbria pilin
MKKTIVAVMVAASAVLSAQAFAAGNSSQLTILGNVTDTGESCNVTPAALIQGGSLTLDDVKPLSWKARASTLHIWRWLKISSTKLKTARKALLRILVT